MTLTSNTPQQINSALFALDRNIKNIEGNMDLQTQILTEAQTRSNADTALANSINSLSSEVSQVQQNITEEAQQRSDADTALTNSINNVASELSQAQLTAYAYGASGSAATDVTQVITISGSTSYNAAAGSRVLVSFPNGYAPSNEDSELLLQIGNMAALPALAQGVAMKYGSVSAGAMIEFTYTGSAWCCQSNIVKATSDYTLYADGSIKYNTSKVDSLLSIRARVFSSAISITTTSQGIAQISNRHLPIGAYNCPYVLHFFNGSSNGYDYYVQVLDYDGNPIANQTVTLALLYIPDILTIAQPQD